MMNYGYFDNKKYEYIITNPRTPVKWINYLGTIHFGGFVDHTGGSLICRGDPALNRITKYIPQLPASHIRGETLYLRIQNKTGFDIITPYFTPGLQPCDSYECHVGLGYSRIIASYKGIRCCATIFIPQDRPVVLRDIKITNTTDKPFTVDAIPVVEYTHPDALKQFTNADWVPQTMQSKRLDDPDMPLTILQYPFMFRDRKVNFFSCSHTASSFETDRSRFLGDNEYATWANPQALHKDEFSNHEAQRGDNIAALLVRLGSIAPGQSKRFTTMLGQSDNNRKVAEIVKAFRDESKVDEAFESLTTQWRNYLKALQVKTPDPNFDIMVNIHNPRQAYITLNWSRYLSLYQLGLGARGIGFRDSSQDILGVLDHSPSQALPLIRKLLSVQRRDGSAMHQFNPQSMFATTGDAVEMEDRPDFYGDDHLWIVLAVCNFLKETGNYRFLDESIPYYEKDKKEEPLERTPVLVHLTRALAFTKSHTGRHGLPLLGFADWNDCVNLETGSESSLLACLYGAALMEMIALMRHLGNEAQQRAYQHDYEEMKAQFNAVAWDGEWYVRYFDADNVKLGSSLNQYGKIYTNAQSWAVISGFAFWERGRQAMDSVHYHLNTSKGIKLSTPGFNGYDPTRGGITTYPPGAKENCGIFLHANPWAMIAECKLGNGDRAWQYYNQINPAAKNDIIDEYEVEPYVYAQNILGDEHPQFGLGRNSWLSGTASWAYQAATQYILGIRPTHDGLQIDPIIPNHWDTFEVTRKFRGSTYHIKVTNPDGKKGGIGEMTVDGRKKNGNVIPILSTDREHFIEAQMN
ncbi:MAG: glycosyl transferase [Chitinivibrionales bacterium]|nr:glycosyl transferase [Chitinivibrionales bacterium]